MAFSGSETEFLQTYPTAQKVGKSVHVWIVQGREYMPLHNNSLHEDLQQRDLTINACALDEDGHIFAHPLAFYDIKHGILRPASPKAFFQDPTRIFRLARFAAAYPHFSLHTDALKQAQAVVQAKKHEDLPAERVGRELFKALHMPCPWRFFHCVFTTQSMHPWFTELYEIYVQNPTLLKGWGQCMDTCAQDIGSPYELALFRWMLLGAFLNMQGDSPSIGEASEDILEALGEKLCLPTAFTKAALCMASHVQRVHGAQRAQTLQHLSPAEQVSLVLAVHKKGLSKLFWAGVDHIWPQAQQSSYALAVLNVVLQVHLPLEFQDQGAASGEKLYQLQIAALENFLHR